MLIVDGVESTGEDSYFGPILLDPNTNYFYKSWDEHFYQKIDSYPEAKSGHAIKWELVKKFPEVLCFQINRAAYNKEQQRIEKINSKFEFDETIYCDRFLHENKDVVKEIRSKCDALQQEMDGIDLELKSISNFHEGRNLSKSVEDVIVMLDVLNQTGASRQLPASLVESYQPSAEFIGQLRDIKAKLDEEITKLKARKSSIIQEIKSAFSSVDKSKYNIFSIIIHEGTADHGHFYCFIKWGSRWFKFNDFHVRETPQEEVMKIAFGDASSIASAYCLFYMKEDMMNRFSGHNFQLIKDPLPPAGYFSWLTPSKLFNIRSLNSNYHKELSKLSVKKIVTQYASKFDQVKKQFGDFYKETPKFQGMRSIFDFILHVQTNTSRNQSDLHTVFNSLMLGNVLRQMSAKGLVGFDLEKIDDNPIGFEQLRADLTALSVELIQASKRSAWSTSKSKG
jgi:Ubiquitin carboxyl-terminal hydrolase